MKDKEHKFTVYIPIEVGVTKDDNYEKNLAYVLSTLANETFSTVSGDYYWRKKRGKISNLIVKDLWQ
jgi:hypothetical protein